MPRRAAGVYTVWRKTELIYVGTSGRGAAAEAFAASPGLPGKAMGLWTRLNSHASGRRSGDQFNVYICDRFIIPALTPAQQHDIGHGHLLLDQLTRAYIRQHLNYRFQVFPDGTSALAIERDIRAGWTSPSRRSTSTYHGSRSDRKSWTTFSPPRESRPSPCSQPRTCC